MGVPFEALLPYGICLAVRHHLDLPHAVNPSLTHSRAVLRYHWCRSLKDQEHPERWQARQTLYRSVGQTKCAIPSHATAQ